MLLQVSLIFTSMKICPSLYLHCHICSGFKRWTTGISADIIGGKTRTNEVHPSATQFCHLSVVLSSGDFTDKFAVLILSLLFMISYLDWSTCLFTNTKEPTPAVMTKAQLTITFAALLRNILPSRSRPTPSEIEMELRLLNA